MNTPDNKKTWFYALVAEELLQRLDPIRIAPENILVAGDAISEQLGARYPAAKMMHSYDPDKKIQLIVANLVLPETFMPVLQSWQYILQPGGLLMLTAFGPDTLQELRAQSQSVSLPFMLDMHDLGDALVAAGFSDPVLDVEYLTLTWRGSDKMLRELKDINMLAENIENFQMEKNADGVFAVTVEVIYAHAWKVEREKSGETRIPVTSLRGRSAGRSNCKSGL